MKEPSKLENENDWLNLAAVLGAGLPRKEHFQQSDERSQTWVDWKLSGDAVGKFSGEAKKGIQWQLTGKRKSRLGRLGIFLVWEDKANGEEILKLLQQSDSLGQKDGWMKWQVLLWGNSEVDEREFEGILVFWSCFILWCWKPGWEMLRSREYSTKVVRVWKINRWTGWRRQNKSSV